MTGTKQLAAEQRWLRGEDPRSLLREFGSHKVSALHRSIAKRVEQVLCSDDLRPCLAELEQRNTNRGAAFLLGPQLFRILLSFEAKNDACLVWPALKESAAEIRAHFKNAATRSRRLAKLIRKGPHAHIVTVKCDAFENGMSPFAPFPIIQGPREYAAPVSLAWLLDEAAKAFEQTAQHTPRPKRNQRRSAETKGEELKALTVTLTDVFKRELGKPYAGHVATIAKLVSGKETHEEYVNKASQRRKLK